jgi:hypothetical protein
MIAVNLNSKIINTATPISIAYLLGASDAETKHFMGAAHRPTRRKLHYEHHNFGSDPA